MTGWTDDREAQLRADGWTDADIRDFKRGWESASSAAEGRSWVPAAPKPPEPPQYVQLGDHFPRNSERARWQRETDAGKLSRMVPAEDDAEVLAQAKQMQDAKEYAYGNRPDLAQCLMAVRHASPRTVEISGTTAEVAQVFRQAGIACQVVQGYEPPATTGPVQVHRV